MHVVLRLHADPALAALPVLVLLRRVNDRPAWTEQDNYGILCYLTLRSSRDSILCSSHFAVCDRGQVGALSTGCHLFRYQR